MECGIFSGWPFGYSWCAQKNPERGKLEFLSMHFLFKIYEVPVIHVWTYICVMNYHPKTKLVVIYIRIS